VTEALKRKTEGTRHKPRVPVDGRKRAKLRIEGGEKPNSEERCRKKGGGKGRGGNETTKSQRRINSSKFPKEKEKSNEDRPNVGGREKQPRAS